MGAILGDTGCLLPGLRVGVFCASCPEAGPGEDRVGIRGWLCLGVGVCGAGALSRAGGLGEDRVFKGGVEPNELKRLRGCGTLGLRNSVFASSMAAGPGDDRVCIRGWGRCEDAGVCSALSRAAGLGEDRVCIRR